MTKKKENNTVLVIFVEGDTEVDFYKKMVASIRQKAGKGNCSIEIKNVKGVGNYQKKVCRIFENSIKQRYPGFNYVVALCYDTDVFQYSKKPPVNWISVVKNLKEKGVDQVAQVRAKKSIEDWFLLDSIGLKQFLRLPAKMDVSSFKGQNGIVQLFNKANKSYIKGVQCKGLVDALNMDKIFPYICSEIRFICDTIGVKCSSVNERCKL